MNTKLTVVGEVCVWDTIGPPPLVTNGIGPETIKGTLPVRVTVAVETVGVSVTAGR